MGNFRDIMEKDGNFKKYVGPEKNKDKQLNKLSSGEVKNLIKFIEKSGQWDKFVESVEDATDQWFDDDDYMEYGIDVVGYPEDPDGAGDWDGHDRNQWFDDMLHDQKGFMSLVPIEETLDNFVTQIDEL